MSPPVDEIHRRLSQGSAYPVLPTPASTENNAFVTDDLQKPLKDLSGSDKALFEVLDDFATTKGEELCYWAFQALPPPRGGPSLIHPRRGYWDVSDGHNDQDVEWVQAYGEVAVARLHSRVKTNGPVVGAMCAMGSHITKRRCENGRSEKWKCVPAVTNATIAWPMAVSIWKIGHPELQSAVEDWRGNSNSGHVPNIEWDAHTPGTSPGRPWTGSMPKPGELNPSSMPTGPAWPGSKDTYWGSPKIAKVVKCSDIPAKFNYNTEDLYYCDRIPNATSKVSSVDEAYAVWKSLKGVWPPTKPCADDLVALKQWLTKIAPTLSDSNCSEAYATLQKYMPNFDCENSDFKPTFRHMCCSVCGAQPMPDVPSPAPSPPPSAYYACSTCNHIYDAAKDGGGKAFEDLPSTWMCPVCGAPKAAYSQRASGEQEIYM